MTLYLQPKIYRNVKMTRVQISSDLHLESHPDWVFDSLIRKTGDILVLAGDIHSLYLLDDYKKFVDHCQSLFDLVVVVFGNNEYYWRERYGAPRTMDDLTKTAVAELSSPSVSVLVDSSIVYEGISIFGGCGWNDMIGCNVNQTTFPIHGVDVEDVAGLHLSFRKSLTEFLDGKHDKILIVTHYCPLQVECVRNKSYPYDDDSRRWYCNFSDEIETRNLTWVSGHTHQCHDVFINMSRLVSNQDPHPVGTSYRADKTIVI